MKIAWISSWPPRHCGIATYSQDLVGALRNLGHHVMIICHQDGGRPGEEDVYPVLPVNEQLEINDPGWHEKLYETVNDLNPDVVHIQHEYGLYVRKYNEGDDASAGLLPALFRWQVECKFPTIMTYHSVYTTLDRAQSYFMNLSLMLLSAGIVHEEYQRAYLAQNIGRVPQNVYVIPHGAKEAQPYPKAKEELGLGGKKVVGMIGWWEPNKGFERVVRLWDRIYKELGDSAVLVIAGDARPGSSSGQVYKPLLMKEIACSPVRESIKVIQGSFSPEEYDKVLSAFDLAVLPYSHASQSGNLAHAFALGIPAVVTALEGLKSQIEESGAGIDVDVDDDLELARAITMIMKDDELRQQYSKNAKEYVTSEIKWSAIAFKHQRLYEYRRERMYQDVELGPEYRRVHF